MKVQSIRNLITKLHEVLLRVGAIGQVLAALKLWLLYRIVYMQLSSIKVSNYKQLGKIDQ